MSNIGSGMRSRVERLREDWITMNAEAANRRETYNFEPAKTAGSWTA